MGVSKKPFKRIDRMRAHHLANLYLDFLEDGEVPDRDRGVYGRYILQFPILVTDSITPLCKDDCKYPLINFCKGSHMAEWDRFSAEKLGVKLGTRYYKEELQEIFHSRAVEHKLQIGKEYFIDDVLDSLYGYDWRRKLHPNQYSQAFRQHQQPCKNTHTHCHTKQ